MTAPEGGGALTAALMTLSKHGDQLREHDRILASLGGLAETVEQLAEELPVGKRSGPAYDPIPAVQWWRLDGDERAEAIGRIRSWVDHIFRPMYGHLAAQLGECWPSHPLALMTLDWLSELWSVLYLDTERDARILTAQAEYSVRIMPAAAAQLGTETAGCTRHIEPATRRQP
jgi:hypothetical protein